MSNGGGDGAVPRPRRIDVHRYLLVPRRSKSVGGLAAPGAPRRGCLLRVQWTDLPAPGHADLHPWPELGDSPLEEQLSALFRGARAPGANAQRALGFARAEAEARPAGESLFAGRAPIENHRYLGGLDVGSPPPRDETTTSRFRCFKVKLGGYPAEAEAEALRRLVETLPAGSRLRLDFNGRLAGAEAFRRVWPMYAPAVGARLDWIEDPLAKFDAAEWRRLQAEFSVRFALDRGGESEFARAAEHARSGAVRVWVLKPAVQDERLLADALQSLPKEEAPEICVTSYLDHPLGQLEALWTASALRDGANVRLAVCGLASHVAYEPTEFSDLLRLDGACLVPPSGAGWGWTERLESLAWEPLV